MIDGFIAKLGCTVRECIDCGCLVPGGPTRCKRCAREQGRKIRGWGDVAWLLVWRTPLKRIPKLRNWSTQAWCKQYKISLFPDASEPAGGGDAS